MVDRMSENRDKPSGKRMNATNDTSVRDTPYSRSSQQENQMVMPSSSQQNYANYGMQPRAQKIMPQGTQVNLGDHKVDYTSSAQASYGKPPSKYVTAPLTNCFAFVVLRPDRPNPWLRREMRMRAPGGKVTDPTWTPSRLRRRFLTLSPTAR